MMFVEDLMKEFYLKIKGQRVLIVVNYDIDAICACQILLTLFRADDTLYTLVPVDVTSDLKNAIRENLIDEKYVIFINCGGTIDLLEELPLSEKITLFVLDSHRPLDVCNIYNPAQVKLLSKADQSIPKFQDIFSDDSEDENIDSNINGIEDDESGSSNNQQCKRRRLTEEAILKRKEKKLWESQRDSLLFNYTKFSYYGRSSALILYDLAWGIARDCFDLLWYAIVGLSEQFLMRKIDEKNYITECGVMQNHVLRLTNVLSKLNPEENTAMQIKFEKDLRLALIRHWTLKSSITYSAFTATKLNLWTFQGEKKLHEMLAEIGIPLIQCNQKFASMDLVFRKEIHQSLENIAQKYFLDGIVFISFLLQYGFRNKYSAMDFVYGLLALLQSCNDEKTKAECFSECLEALCRTGKESLDKGIELAKQILISIFKQVQNALEMKQIQCSGPFLYLILQEGNVDSTLCSHPYGILLLAEFALRAFIASSKTRRYKTLPLVISTPYSKGAEYSKDKMTEPLCHITGAAPLTQKNNANFFGRAFKKAAEISLTPVQDVYFDSSVIKLNVKDRARFLDTLAVLLNED